MVDSKSTVITTSLQEKENNRYYAVSQKRPQPSTPIAKRFEPTLAKPSRFRIYLLNHSDTVSNYKPFRNRTQCRDRTDDHTIKSRALCQTELIRQTEWSLADAQLNTAKHTSYKQPYHDSKQHPCPLFQNFSFSPIHS